MIKVSFSISLKQRLDLLEEGSTTLALPSGSGIERGDLISVHHLHHSIRSFSMMVTLKHEGREGQDDVYVLVPWDSIEEAAGESPSKEFQIGLDPGLGL